MSHAPIPNQTKSSNMLEFEQADLLAKGYHGHSGRPQLIRPSRVAEATTVVSRSGVVSANFYTATDVALRIDGTLKGEVVIETGGLVHVTTFGSAESTRIEADYVFVDGSVRGSILARKGLEISASGDVSGSITYEGEMAVHAGARVAGQICRR